MGKLLKLEYIQAELEKENIMTLFQQTIISLIRGALEPAYTAPIPEDFDWSAAYELGRSHQIIPILYYGALNLHAAMPEDSRAKFENSTYICAVADIKQQFEIDRIFKSFEENCIPYLPVKGCVLKALYPKSEMRLMGDGDILVHNRKDGAISAVMEGLGYAFTNEDKGVDVWDKAPSIHIELHDMLFPNEGPVYCKYYSNVWNMSKAMDNKMRYAMPGNDEFIYLFSHFAKHYRSGGIGIRQFVDFHVYRLANPDLDFAYIGKELRKLRLYSFYKNAAKTLDVWFEDAASSEITDFITGRIFYSGSFGQREDKSSAKALKETKKLGSLGKARTKRLFYVMFLPFTAMRKKYPILDKYPCLLPVMWVVRLVRGIFCKRRTVKKELVNIKKMNQENIKKYDVELNYVGLDYDLWENNK